MKQIEVHKHKASIRDSKMLLLRKLGEMKCEASSAADGLHTLTISFPMGNEFAAQVAVEQTVPVENLATVTSQLLVQLDAIEAGLHQITGCLDPLAVDTAILLNGATAAVNLLKRELGSESGRIDVIRLCVLVLKWLVTKGNVFVNAVLASTGTTVGMEMANRLLNIDIPAVVTQLEHWIQ